MNHYSFEAVIFDLDGVITKTDLVHLQAWKSVFDEYLRLREKRDKKPFREFTYENDYLAYVDGKPRQEGTRSFLWSRKISLPLGKPDDSSEAETVWGISNKKNKKFLEILQKNGVEVFPSTVHLIKELKKADVPVGVVSSSKNCRRILESTGLADLFPVRVDGEIAARLGLKGKPDGDIFVTAAQKLRVAPIKSVVVEDAVSGVAAGRNGGFGLVLGIARKNNQSQLLQNGADAAVEDLAKVNLDWLEKWFQRKPKPLFQSWNEPEKKRGEKDIVLNPCYFRNPKSFFASVKKPVFFLDYDGTLTPIVERPELAVISREMKKTLKRLSEKYTTAIVSGRMRKDVEKLVGIKNLFYAGSHGFDIAGPGISMIQPQAKRAIPLIVKITEDLSKELKNIPGLLVEEKKFSVAVHYRLVEEKYLPGIKGLVDKIVQKNPSLLLVKGKKVFEIMPAIYWNKGKAVTWIMQVLGISWENSLVIYIGDDVTDENAFGVIRTRGVGIMVGEKPEKSAADFRLASPEEVKQFFEELL